MGTNSAIQWTTHTFNIVWGCSKVSEACKFCYAEAFAKRTGHDVWGPDKPRPVLSADYWKQPFAWDAAAKKAGERHRVFCSSMADVFEDHQTLAGQRLRLWPIIAGTPNLDWLLLTKRPENITKFAPVEWAGGWPKNVWMGTTTETQERADERIPWLVDVPVAVRFLSCEPLLGPIDLENIHPYYLKRRDLGPFAPTVRLDCLRGHMKGPDEMTEQKIHWVIVGGESGPGARGFIMQWGLDIVRACRGAKVPVFVKQLGANIYENGDGEGEILPRIRLSDRKGGDMSEWPWRQLMVREFPGEVR